MPIRTTPLVSGQLYHVFNRSIERKPIFVSQRECQRALKTLDFYRFKKPPLKLSQFLKLNDEEKEKMMIRLRTSNPEIISLISFVLMPNHFHFLIQQNIEEGISKFVKNFTDSFTRYSNTKNERLGTLFQGQFKAILIETDAQLLHLSRYIHLNPLTSCIVKNFDQLINYPWSSLGQYLKEEEGICRTDTVLGHFSSREKYYQFIFDQADYQRTLENIKHLLLE
jgi:putative transposase